MAYTTINKSSLHFNTKLYTGNGSTQSITGVGFQPDWVWLKKRDASASHELYDAVRGVTKRLKSDATNAEFTDANTLTSFDSDGFSLGTGSGINSSSNTFASWNWKAGGGQGSSNTDGSINTTYTSANTTSGFSISSYTGTGSNATIGHGLGVKPSMIICKKLNTTGSWITYHSALGATKYLYLNTTDAEAANSTVWQDIEPTTSVFSVGSASNCNDSGATYVAYCFAEKTGFSKFGTYKGNANADGAFIYTGFKPAFVLIKQSSASGENWNIYDNKRNTFNATDKALFADITNAEATKTGGMDFLSNGIKMRGTDGAFNTSQTYIYMAFAEAPLVGSNNTPATAR